MAAIVTNKSTAFSIILNAGTDSSGNMITKTTSFPAVKVGANVDRILAISQQFEDLAVSPVYTTQRTVVNILSE